MPVLIDSGWAAALEPVGPDIAALGDRLRAEVAAGRQLPSRRRPRAARLPASARRRQGADRRAGPVSDAGASDRALVRGRSARATAAAEPLEHLPGARGRSRHPARAARRPVGVERPGRDAAQQGADRRAGRSGIPPRLGVGEGDRARDPHSRRARSARSSRSCGGGMPRTSRRCWVRRRSSNRRIRRRSRPAAASSAHGRSRARTNCSSGRARHRSIGGFRRRRRLVGMLEEEYDKPRRLPGTCGSRPSPSARSRIAIRAGRGPRHPRHPRDLQLLRDQLRRDLRREEVVGRAVARQGRAPAQARPAVHRGGVAVRPGPRLRVRLSRGRASPPTATPSRTRSTWARPRRARGSAGHCWRPSSPRARRRASARWSP